MILAVSGWRDWTDVGFIFRQLGTMRKRGYTHIRVGDAKGVDRITRSFVTSHDFYTYHIYKADWGYIPRGAGVVRNVRMLKGVEEDNTLADLLIAFPQPGVDHEKDSGTWRCMKQAHKLGIPVWAPGYREDEKPCGQDSLFG